MVTGGSALDAQVRDLLIPGDTAWQEVILLRGELALSAAVEEQVIEALQPGQTTVRRVAGSTRDEAGQDEPTAIVDGADIQRARFGAMGD